MAARDGCKVDRAIETFDLREADPRHDDIDAGLLARWRGDGGASSMGYRPLTTWFNERLVRQALVAAGEDPFGPRVEYVQDALAGDDDLLREEVLDRLETLGVDGSALADALVSWGTMRTHLQDCLGGEKPAGGSGDWERETIDRARAFATEKVESAVGSLASKGALAGVDDDAVRVEIYLACGECPTRTPLEIALDRGYVCEDHR